LTTDYLLDIRTDLAQLLRETTTGGPTTDDTWYMLGLDIIGQQRNGAWSYFGYDGLGSVRHLTDEYGSITARMSYDPYGAPIQPNTASSLGFTGELTDPLGLIYLRARTYNPALGIFTSRDPVLGVAGLSASYNGYGYVHGNPVNYRDPSGGV
ncbi:MAG: RHS repeat-associated core domain-containing protein, partial [Anaerolineae bacterium]|nr:RHS repeat-associated core domain-containing protein [Anaerolineae bacterium]